jgi:hypothetical protein
VSGVTDAMIGEDCSRSEGGRTTMAASGGLDDWSRGLVTQDMVDTMENVARLMRRISLTAWKDAIHRLCRDCARVGAIFGRPERRATMYLSPASTCSACSLSTLVRSLVINAFHVRSCTATDHTHPLTNTTRTMTALRIANKVPSLPRTVPFLCECAGHTDPTHYHWLTSLTTPSHPSARQPYHPAI